MDKPTTKEQMIYESYILIKSLEERVDKHSTDHTDSFRRLWQKLDEVKEAFMEDKEEISQLIEQQNRRILALETERKIGLKIITPIVAAAFGFFSAWLSRLFFKEH